jgi:hypothetical protein
VKRTTDLDAIDRVTVAVWRLTNVVGWGLIGMALYLLPQIVFTAAADALQGRISAVIAAPALVVFAASVLVVLPALVGRLIGERVYRWPAWTAALAVGLPHAYRLAAADRPLETADLAGTLGIAGIGIFIAAVTAHHAWSGRPRALRAPVSR